MGDTAMVIVAIGVAVVIIFVFPLVEIANKQDEVTTMEVSELTTEFVNRITNTGRLTSEDLNNFKQELAASGSYDVQIKLQKIDENLSKKEYAAQVTIGDNTYYVMYPTQVMEALRGDGSSDDTEIPLQQGDLVYVYVINTNQTVFQSLIKAIFGNKGEDSGAITSKAVGEVKVSGN